MSTVRRSYDREFKINAAKLYLEGNKSLDILASELGVPTGTYAKWVKDYQECGIESFPGKGKVKVCNEELFQLRKELADVRQERDILKKALAIFSQKK